jgi:hypothetical protein
MKKMLLLVSVVMMVLSVTAGAAVALPTQATNYWTTEATCDGLGDIVIEVVNLGSWGAAQFQVDGGETMTAIPRWFTFSATDMSTNQVVFTESHTKKPAQIDDVCRYSWIEVVPEGDPYVPAGTYLLEAEVGIKIAGR